MKCNKILTKPRNLKVINITDEPKKEVIFVGTDHLGNKKSESIQVSETLYKKLFG